MAELSIAKGCCEMIFDRLVFFLSPSLRKQPPSPIRSSIHSIALLEDPMLVALSSEALAKRPPGSNKAGREGIAPDRLLRCVVLKHIKGWSYRQLHRELRASLLYRRFTRFYEDPIPDFSNLCRAFALFGKGRLSPNRAARQKQRWFRRGQGWRAGIEARMSTLKHCFGMQRALYKGEIGFERHVGWCIIAHNLVAISRAGRQSSARRCRSG